MMEFREGSSGGWLARIIPGPGAFGAPHSGEPTSMSAIRPIRLFAPAVLLAACAACATLAAVAPDAKGDVNTSGADRGRALFMTSACANCHGVTKEDNMKVGPSLFGVVGRKAGTAPSLLGASENLKKYGVTWDAETLDEFLANPDAKVPGTPMSGVLADPQQRADIIAYLTTLTTVTP